MLEVFGVGEKQDVEEELMLEMAEVEDKQKEEELMLEMAAVKKKW